MAYILPQLRMMLAKNEFRNLITNECPVVPFRLRLVIKFILSYQVLFICYIQIRKIQTLKSVSLTQVYVHVQPKTLSNIVDENEIDDKHLFC